MPDAVISSDCLSSAWAGAASTVARAWLSAVIAPAVPDCSSGELTSLIGIEQALACVSDVLSTSRKVEVGACGERGLYDPLVAMDLAGGVQVTATQLWRIERSGCAAIDTAKELGQELLDLACAHRVLPGDVLVSRVAQSSDVIGFLRTRIIGSDFAVQRDAHVVDVYTSRFADELLTNAGGRPSQHMQLRTFTLLGSEVLQMAAYPMPPISAGTRLWCDEAVIWLFIAEGADGDNVVSVLENIQPLWERLRAHHSCPIDRAEPVELTQLYPVPHRVLPMSEYERRNLEASVETLRSQEPLTNLLKEDGTPRASVDDVLRARHDLQKHLERMAIVLEHSHGSARSKFNVMQDSAFELLPTTEHEAFDHVLAPHRHFVDGMEETRRNLNSIAVESSATASLITSAAVGRLLDRSRASRISGSAVASAAFFVAVLSIYLTLLSVPPRRERAIPDVTKLAGWVGAAGGAVGLTAYGLALASAVRSSTLPAWVKRYRRTILISAAAVSVLFFVSGALTGWPLLVIAGGIVMLGWLILSALANDY